MVWFNDDVMDEWDRMQNEMDHLFGRIFGAQPLLAHRGSNALAPLTGFRMPVCQMKHTPKSVVTTFEIPGVDKGDIQLNVTDDSIEVKVEKKQEKEVKKKDMQAYSSVQRRFYRKIPLPVDVIAGKATAEYKDGVLKVEVPKKKVLEAKPNRISVK